MKVYGPRGNQWKIQLWVSVAAKQESKNQRVTSCEAAPSIELWVTGPRSLGWPALLWQWTFWGTLTAGWQQFISWLCLKYPLNSQKKTGKTLQSVRFLPLLGSEEPFFVAFSCSMQRRRRRGVVVLKSSLFSPHLWQQLFGVLISAFHKLPTVPCMFPQSLVFPWIHCLKPQPGWTRLGAALMEGVPLPITGGGTRWD